MLVQVHIKMLLLAVISIVIETTDWTCTLHLHMKTTDHAHW